MEMINRLIGKVASDIKFLKPVEPYKQKGITAEGQFILEKRREEKINEKQNSTRKKESDAKLKKSKQ